MGTFFYTKSFKKHIRSLSLESIVPQDGKEDVIETGKGVSVVASNN